MTTFATRPDVVHSTPAQVFVQCAGQTLTLADATRNARGNYDAIVNSKKALLDSRIAFGRMCIALKRALGHGKWMGYREEQGWHDKTVDSAVRIAEAVDAGTIDPATCDSLRQAEIAVGVRSANSHSGANLNGQGTQRTPLHATYGVHDGWTNSHSGANLNGFHGEREPRPEFDEDQHIFDCWPPEVRAAFHAANEDNKRGGHGEWSPRDFVAKSQDPIFYPPHPFAAWQDLLYDGYWPKPTIVPVTADEVAEEMRALGEGDQATRRPVENKGPAEGDDVHSPSADSPSSPIALEVAEIGGVLVKATPEAIAEIRQAHEDAYEEAEQLTLTGLFAEAESRLSQAIDRVRHGDVTESQARRITTAITEILAEGRAA